MTCFSNSHVFADGATTCMCGMESQKYLPTFDKFVDDLWFCGNSSVGGVPELAYLGLCITGEAGEIAEKLKKAYRDEERVTDKLVLAMELGDVLFYVTRMAHALGYSLEDVAKILVEKLNDRKTRGVLRGQGDER
jgi:NTP pyrophosphatase (non-canonical NTP hydrolase)